MSQHWLRFLKKFGARGAHTEGVLEAGEVDDYVDNPRDYERYDVLFHLYGPLAESPWVPYHCPTLFASIDKCAIRPGSRRPSEAYQEAREETGAWQWLDRGTMVIVDVPGATTIEVGALLMKEVGVQFVSTFDHWASAPDDAGATRVIDARQIIDAMYSVAPDIHERRSELSPDAPPVWLCDSRRLGKGKTSPSPGEFDNRYYIDNSILPGIDSLRSGGIRRVVYLSEAMGSGPLGDLDAPPDVASFVADVFDAGLTVEQVALGHKGSWTNPVPVQQRPFETDLPVRGFSRSDMGGFGKVIPEPSEGSYSSGGVGG